MKDLKIFLVEDNEGDILLMEEALKELNIHYHLIVAKDGEEAVSFLFNCRLFPFNQLPDVILLDINLPKIDGIELLKAIKNESRFNNVPVIILSGSVLEKDIVNSGIYTADDYVTKPLGVNYFIQLVKNKKEFTNA